VLGKKTQDFKKQEKKRAKAKMDKRERRAGCPRSLDAGLDL
jgi:hypothetical protein